MRDASQPGNRTQALPASLLEWYDRHARALPWRVPPEDSRAGARPDPYRVWLSEVMLQQTTVAAVKDYFHRFTTRWPGVADLAAAEDGDVMGEWAGLGYYARARNLLKCARTVVADHGGVFPDTREGLLTLPGIGPYTASAIAAIAFGRAETVVDGNVERVMARLHDIHTPLPAAKPELTAAAARSTPADRPGDYAQAVMDLGATICTPRNPACGICPWRAPCQARARGTATDLPRKTPKKAQPVRRGIAYVARRADGAWLLERRPDRGLLGGMLGWPGSDWIEGAPPEAPPVAADWTVLGAEARHTFTHFHLLLEIRIATLPHESRPERGEFLDVAAFRPSDLPTVMRKVFDLARPSFDAVM
ncbi:A/G-specific adenine glycosylase [Seohaeicola saemankumensis]|uniref:Adenine DNA glycosylase n=1 Tax=Seohaeicola saemankumensis TaxID=481181 RepID=A0ABW3TIE2_9RHOB